MRYDRFKYNLKSNNFILSPKWCFKCKLYPKVWLENGHIIGEDWTINTLILVSESDSTGSARLGV